MNFSIEKSIAILERTPGVLNALLLGIDEDWSSTHEGPGTWSAYDIVGHLIHGEVTDWIPRATIILSKNADKKFTPFDRFAQAELSKGKLLQQLLEEFKILRERNIRQLREMKITETDLNKTGIHPAFGEVTLAQLLSTWVVHDLNHIAQISRVMAGHYLADVGPWTAYLGILQHKEKQDNQ